MSALREVHSDGWTVRLDLSRQVLQVEIPEDHGGWTGRKSTPILPVLPRQEDSPVSAATLLLKAKQFDDGLYAAVELAAQQGAGGFAGKASLLRSLTATLDAGLLTSDPTAAALMHAACELGGVPVPVPETIAEGVRAFKDSFLRDERQSKPLGFYTWTPELSAIFRQDRFLQQALDPGPADVLDRALARTPGASDAHRAWLALNARLTNPPKPPGLRDAGKRPPFVPASRSHEVTLLESLYEDRPIPDGFDLMSELIRRVRSGELSLMPTEDSGWYDHQTWSLEPLLRPDRRPESARLELGKRYRKHLEDLFRGALALARETHVKQAGGGRGGYGGPLKPPIRVRPALSVEPLPSVYARRANSYRFVRTVLEEAFGPEALVSMHRLTQEGPCDLPLSDELTVMEKLFDGAASTAFRELGMEDRSGTDDSQQVFASWRATVETDADLSRDCRMMVPVYFDEQRQTTKVWAFLGWRTVSVNVEYRTVPEILGVERDLPAAAGAPPRLPPAVEFSCNWHRFAIPVMAETYVTRLLDRDEFRKHCDCFQTREAILASLR
jgi:hypothetical protein